jgi:DNA-binding MarR family transcriptional regulator
MDLRKALDTFYYSTALCDLRLMNKQFIDENITYNSLLYIELIYTMNGRCTASRLAELLNVSKPGVTLKLNELLRLGLITKTPDPKDKRKSYLSVNVEAMPQYKVFRRQDSEAIKRITDQFTAEEIGKFCEMLDIISEINFEEIDGV